MAQLTSEPEAPPPAKHRAPSPRRRALRLAAVVVVIVLAVGTAIVGVLHGLGAPSPPARHGATKPVASRPSTAPRATTFDARAKPAIRAGGPLPERPVTLTLPDRVRVPVQPAPTLSDGTLGVPHNITMAGWWSGGARVGDLFGAMVIAAHVDSTVQGLGPFAALLSARRGDSITVAAAHLSQRFAVSRIALVTKTNRAAVASQFSGRGHDRLVLITCAGPFIPSQGGYQNVAVITATPVGAPAAR